MDLHVFCNLFPVLQMAFAQLGEFMSGDSDVLSKTIKVAELNPTVRFELGPFENVDDNFYKDNRFVKAVHYKNKKIRERLSELEEKVQPERKKTANREIFYWKNYKENGSHQPMKNQFEGVQAKQIHPMDSNREPSELSNFLRELTSVRNKVQTFKTLSPLIANLKSEIHKMEAALIIEPFESLLNFLEKSFTERENRNTFHGINNITCNNQYQIENVFAINRFSKLKEIMNDSSEREMSNDDISTASPGMLQEGDIELLNQLQKNFSRVFAHENVSPQQINQMSKIIDFVERFHGAVVGSKESLNVGVKGKKKVEKVFTDEEFGFLDGEEEKERETIRRKGSVEHWRRRNG